MAGWRGDVFYVSFLLKCFFFFSHANLGVFWFSNLGAGLVFFVGLFGRPNPKVSSWRWNRRLGLVGEGGGLVGKRRVFFFFFQTVGNKVIILEDFWRVSIFFGWVFPMCVVVFFFCISLVLVITLIRNWFLGAWLLAGQFFGYPYGDLGTGQDSIAIAQETLHKMLVKPEKWRNCDAGFAVVSWKTTGSPRKSIEKKPLWELWPILSWANQQRGDQDPSAASDYAGLDGKWPRGGFQTKDHKGTSLFRLREKLD